ncbi:hypothetical protein MHYP_G00110550 [Metynnis hypsauchen]
MYSHDSGTPESRRSITDGLTNRCWRKRTAAARIKETDGLKFNTDVRDYTEQVGEQREIPADRERWC